MPFIVLIGMLLVIPPPQARSERASDTTVQALFVYNFVKFTDWSALGPDEPLTLCVIGDTEMAGALIDLVRGQRVDGRRLGVEAMGSDAPLRACQVLFISKSVIGRSAALLDGLKRVRLLSISDSEGFAHSTGIIEFFVEGGRTRFAVNTDAANRAGLRLSSRLLTLARIVRDEPGR